MSNAFQAWIDMAAGKVTSSVTPANEARPSLQLVNEPILCTNSLAPAAEPTEADFAEARALLSGMRSRVVEPQAPVAPVAADVSEPEPTPAPILQSATYRGLRGGEWGIKVTGPEPKRGDTVAVTTKAGKVKYEIVVKTLWRETPDTVVCRIVPRY